MGEKPPTKMSLNPDEAEQFRKNVTLNLITNRTNYDKLYWSLGVIDNYSNETTVASSGIQFLTISDQYSSALGGTDVIIFFFSFPYKFSSLILVYWALFHRIIYNW